MKPSALAARVIVAAIGSLWAASAAAAPARAGDRRTSQDFGALTFALTGGFQYWTLSGLESSLDARAAQFALDGFRHEPGSFETTYSYGLELQFRLTRRWFARTQIEWTTLAWNDRDLAYVAQLGGRERTPISLSYESRIRTNPLFFAVGVGHARIYRSVRFGLSGNLLVAPLRVEDTLVVFMESETETDVTATGTGLGFELDLTVDYYTDIRTNLFAQLFARKGATEVGLEEEFWESTILPERREVDFDGFGLRLGLRWF